MQCDWRIEAVIGSEIIIYILLFKILPAYSVVPWLVPLLVARWMHREKLMELQVRWRLAASVIKSLKLLKAKEELKKWMVGIFQRIFWEVRIQSNSNVSGIKESWAAMSFIKMLFSVKILSKLSKWGSLVSFSHSYELWISSKGSFMKKITCNILNIFQSAIGTS